jgi:hypothetical protein
MSVGIKKMIGLMSKSLGSNHKFFSVLFNYFIKEDLDG